MRYSPFRPSAGMLVYNDSGGVIPPRSAVVVTGIDTTVATATQESETYVLVEQYSGSPGQILVTGSASIADEGFGRAYADNVLFVAIDTGVATPLAGEQWGPIPNQWAISRGGMGFWPFGLDVNADQDLAIFQRGEGYYYGKLSQNLGTGTTGGNYTTPAFANFDVWHPVPPLYYPGPPLVLSPNTALQGLTAASYDGQVGVIGDGVIVQMTPMGLTFVSVGCQIV